MIPKVFGHRVALNGGSEKRYGVPIECESDISRGKAESFDA